MDNRIKLIKPYIRFEEVAEDLEGIFDTGQFTKGPHVSRLAHSLKEYCGAEHAFLATSATTALSVCLKAVGIQPGDKVGISDFSFPATANVVEDLGAVPVFVDVDLDTYNMSVDDLRNKYSSEMKAVIFVDALGNPSGITEVKRLCHAWGIPLIEDAACAIGSSVGNRKVGSIADLTCFSFHPRKLLTTGEGGAILTNNAEYARWLEVKLNHGASGFRGKGLDFVEFGYNYRMSEIQALMGWKQVEKLDQIVLSRNKAAAAYCEALEPLGFIKQRVNDDAVHNVQSLVFTVPAAIARDELVEQLANHQIESTIGTYCLSGTTFYCTKYNDVQPNSSWLERQTITLPLYEDVDICRVTSVVEACTIEKL